eukprot:2773586-Prymnesium_polylepis.1
MSKARLLRVLKMPQGSEKQLRAMGKVRLCTLTASTSCIVVIVFINDNGTIALRSASAQVYATLLGMPICAEFCARKCLSMQCSEATEPRRRAACGQSLDFDVVKAIHRRVLQDVIDSGEPINVVETHAGISLFTAAL